MNLLAFFRYREPKRATTSYVPGGYTGTPSETHSEGTHSKGTTKLSDKKKSQRKTNREKPAQPTPIRGMKFHSESRRQQSESARSVSSSESGHQRQKRSTITEACKQKEHTGNHQTTTTNNKVGWSQTVNPRRGTGEPGTTKCNGNHRPITNKESLNKYSNGQDTENMPQSPSNSINTRAEAQAKKPYL